MGLLERDKQILKLHIYDQASTQNPNLFAWFSKTADDANIAGKAATNEVYESLREKGFGYWKSFVRALYPTILHGANSGTIIDVQVQSQTSGDLGNVMLVDAYEQAHGLSGQQNAPSLALIY